jgi:hypothetical protein
MHLAHDLAAVDFHGDLADPDFVGNLLVEAASCDQSHDLTLPGGEGLEAGPQSGQGFFVLQPSAIAREAELDRIEQILVAKRFGKKLDRPAPSSP